MNTDPQHPQQTQQRLGKYELRQQVGRGGVGGGGVGDVWKSYDYQTKQDVALKLIHSDLLQADPQFLQRFTTEGQKLTTLRHENIVPVHEVVVTRQQETNTVAYITSDFIQGQTLTTYITKTSRKGNVPPLADIVYLFTSLGVAIDYAHEQGIVHGDIKPNNILLDIQHTQHFISGEPMWTDFGLPRLLGEEVGVCSPFYMSPEQAKGELPGNRSDIYSLGVILYELCTGMQPFRDTSSVAVLLQHINTLPTPPLLINPQIPPALSEVILRAMAKEPANRFSMASLFATAIADACAIRPTTPISREAIAEEERRYLSGTGSYTSIPGVSQPTHPTHPTQPVISTAPKLPVVRPTTPSQPLPKIVAREATLPYTAHPSQAVPSLHTQPNDARTSGTSGTYSVPTPAPSVSALPMSQSSPSHPAVSALSPSLPSTPSSLPPVSSPLPATSSKFSVTAPGKSIPSSPSRTSAHSTNSIRRQSQSREKMIYAALGLLLLIIVAGGLVGGLLLRQQNTAVIGHAFFQNDAFGNADVLHIEMQSISQPPSGQVYRAWLQTNQHRTMFLGTLSATSNGATFVYPGDTQHTNLLSIAQGILVTQESSTSSTNTPLGSTVYQASFDTQSLPYIRNILYQTPNFPQTGGVASGLFETLKGMDDKAGSIVDSIQGTHDLSMAKRQAIRIIELIDGTQYAMESGDLPKGTPSNVDAKVGLISSPTQPGYIDTLSTQLDKLQATVGNNSTQLQHIQNVRNALNDLRTWIQEARTYDVQLVKGQDLSSPSMLDAALHVQQLIADSYTGRIIPPNASPLPIAGSAGAYQAYIECEYLATLDIRHV